MKCQKCNGDGKERNHFGVIIGICPRCYGTGEAQPITNEEFLRTATTEQLAEWIYQLSVMDRIDQPWYFTPIRGSQKIVEWLKQPHR